MAPWIECLSLSLLVAALVVRVFTSGGGIEHFQPGVQILADTVALCSSGCLVAARLLARQAVFQVAGWIPWVLAAWVAWLALGASGASHPDLAWRSVLTFTALPLMGLVALELSWGRPERGALLLGLLLAAVATGAWLAGHEGLIEIPNRILEYQSGDPQLMASIRIQDPSFQAALVERLHSRGAVGPFLLPGLLASACGTALPLLGLVVGRRLRRAKGLGLPGLYPAIGPGVALLGVSLGLVVSRSKGALVSAAVVTCACLLLAPQLRRYRRKLLLLCALGIAVVSAVGLVALGLGPERVGVGLSLTVRLEYWEAALGMWGESPLRGLGINQFREYYSAFKSTRAEEVIHAHNAPLQLLAETGIVGLALFGATLAAFARPGLFVAWGPKACADRGELPWREVLGAAAGVLGGWLLVGAHGDIYHAGTLGPWLFALGGTLALTPLLAWGLWGLSPRLLAGAALAGATVLIGDGVLNFGVHHAGLSLIVWLLLGLAPSMARSERSAGGETRGGAALGALVCVATLVLVGHVLPGALDAEASRFEARAHHEAAALAGGRAARTPDAEQARKLQGQVNAELEAAQEAFARACAAAPLNARTWLERGAVESRLGDQEAGLASTREAIRLAPRKAGAWFQLGLLLAGPDATGSQLAEAQGAFDETVALYPSHPEHLLEAASVRVRRAALEGAGATRSVLLDEAGALLERAEEVSELVRLKRIRLRPEQVERISLLRARVLKLRSSD